MRNKCLARMALATLFTACTAFPQTTDTKPEAKPETKTDAKSDAKSEAKPEFEVASIKPAGALEPQKLMSGKMRIGVNIDAARVSIGSLSLADLIRIAYKVKTYQVVGPDWLKTSRFDIDATIPEGVSKDNMPEMLQALLVDRFKLTIHRENKEQSIYALVVGKTGVKMKEAPPDPATPPPPADEPPGKGGMVFGSGDNQVRIKASSDGKGTVVTNPQFGEMKVTMAEGGMHMEFAKMSMEGLVEMLTRFSDRPVIDMTELKGKYQVGLDLSMDEMRNAARAAGMGGAMMGGGPGGPGGPGLGGGGGEGGGGSAAGGAPEASTPTGGSIFNSMKQLGLKMDPRKAPVEMIMIDHIEKTPTDN